MQHKVRLFTLIAVLGISVLFGVYWFQQYLRGSKASTVPAVSFAVADGKKIAPGDSFDILVQIAPNAKTFYSVDLSFTYDTAKLQLKDEADPVTNLTALSTTGSDVVDVELLKTGTSVDPATGRVKIMAVRQNDTNSPFIGGKDPISIVKVSFVMKPTATLPFTLAWDATSKTSLPDVIEKTNLTYTGIDPTITAGATGIPPVGAATATPKPGAASPYPTTGIVKCGIDVCQAGFFCYYPPVSDCVAGETCIEMFSDPYCKQKDGKLELTPTPVLGTAGKVATTTRIYERQDTLYINSIMQYPAPLRYEQQIKLNKGTYALVMGARLYNKRGSGLVLVVQCNEASCGENDDKKQLHQNDVIYRTPTFPLKTEFSELRQLFNVSDSVGGKQLVLRVYCEDGSECDIDYISLEDAWGSELIRNPQFAEVQPMNNPRKQPAFWEVDATANMYGSIDPAIGNRGALMINNSAK